MRLGKYPCITAEGTKLRECYGKEEIDERHRHRYEFNNDYRAEMQEPRPCDLRYQPGWPPGGSC